MVKDMEIINIKGPENKEFPTFSDPQFLFTQIEE